MIQFATRAKSQTAPVVSVLSILKSTEFRHDYHQALELADESPAAQQTAVRRVIERYFRLEQIAPDAPLNPGSFYFTEEPIKVEGHYKVLVPGAIKRELIAGLLFLLTSKAPSIDRLAEAKEFDSAISAVVAVRLTLMPERVNGIISFISDAKKFYVNNDTASAERAMGTALDHFNRAAAEGLRIIKSDAERGKRSNEIAGTRRLVADLRKKLQTELTGPRRTTPHGF